MRKKPVKVLTKLFGCYKFVRILDKTDPQNGCTIVMKKRGAGAEAHAEPQAPANVKLSPPYVDTNTSSNCLTPQKFKSRKRTSNLFILRLDARIYDDTARAIERICGPNKSHASLVRAMANVARILEDELAVCNSEIEYERVLLNRFRAI